MTLPTAIVFPGQGSQRLGMLADIAERYPVVQRLFNQASDLLDIDYWSLIQNGPEEQLNHTLNTQVVMLVADVAVYRVLQELSTITPIVMAGHSLGEYPALVCAGALSFADAVRLVHRRASLMQETVPLGLGAMAAIIALTNEQVSQLCLEASTTESQVMPANFNAPGQVVIAGHQEAVNRAVNLAESYGASLAKVLPVSVPCHCDLLKGAAESFVDDLERTVFKQPDCKVISNVDAKAYTSVDEIKKKLAEQLYRPVLWVESVQTMRDMGVERILESGPGRVLSGLIKRIDRSINLSPLGDLENISKLV